MENQFLKLKMTIGVFTLETREEIGRTCYREKRKNLEDISAKSLISH